MIYNRISTNTIGIIELHGGFSCVFVENQRPTEFILNATFYSFNDAEKNAIALAIKENTIYTGFINLEKPILTAVNTDRGWTVIGMSKDTSMAFEINEKMALCNESAAKKTAVKLASLYQYFYINMPNYLL